MIKLSAGTAHVLGLKQLKADSFPTTAYLMQGEKCIQDCGFCPQARNATSRADLLSRITWMTEKKEVIANHLITAYNKGQLKRACFQVVDGKNVLASVKSIVKEISQCDIPISVSARVKDVEELMALAEVGVQRIGLALDAASPRVYQNVKTGNWEKSLQLISEAARLLPGRISTHLIIGLGETEQEAVELMQNMKKIGVTVGLFAFTPVPGTKMALAKQPTLSHYRRMQVANYLISQELVDAAKFTFKDGHLVSYGLSIKQLKKYLETGTAFETSGCKDCNRPYYNERPGGVIYNYSWPLQTKEIEAAIDIVIQSLVDSESGVARNG